MPRCVFLTLADRGNFVIDDELAYPALAQRGFDVEAIPWNDPHVDWNDFDIVVIRSTWDYQSQPDKFLAALAAIENSSALLANSHAIAKWNLQKTYLARLQQDGVDIVPSLFGGALAGGELPSIFDRLDCDEIVIKPQVSHTAQGAFRLQRDTAADRAVEVERYYLDTAYLAQPMVRSIVTEGEYSLFYFNGEYSHAISKRPKPGDFRSQEEHGSDILPATADAALRAAGRAAVDAVKEPLLYARADFVRSNFDDNYWLMELELIEPALYFRMDPQSPQRFALALTDWFERYTRK